jgi:hypothetical protein
MKRSENPFRLWQGRVFYRGRWRTPKQVASQRRYSREYIKNKRRSPAWRTQEREKNWLAKRALLATPEGYTRLRAHWRAYCAKHKAKRARNQLERYYRTKRKCPELNFVKAYGKTFAKELHKLHLTMRELKQKRKGN